MPTQQGPLLARRLQGILGMKHHRTTSARGLLAALVLSATSACQDTPPEDTTMPAPQGEEGHPGVGIAIADASLSPTAASIVREHAPEGIKVARVAAILRLDLGDEVAYDLAELQGGGYVLASRGEHDLPSPEWSDEGPSPLAELRQQAAHRGARVEKIYRIGAHTYAAEDADGQLVAFVGEPPARRRLLSDSPPPATVRTQTEPLDPREDGDSQGVTPGRRRVREGDPEPGFIHEPFSDWSELKRWLREDGAVRERSRRLSARARTAWGPLRAPHAAAPGLGVELPSGTPDLAPLLEPSALAACGANGFGAWYVRVVNNRHAFINGATKNSATKNGDANHVYDANKGDFTSLQPNYSQFTSNQFAGWNGEACYSGCGPTAWAMLFAWADRAADVQNPENLRWRDRDGFFPGAVPFSTTSGAYNAADPVHNWVVTLHDLVETSCGTGLVNNSSYTYPWNMDQASDYLDGRTRATLSTVYSNILWEDDEYRDAARASILNDRTPAVIGYGSLVVSHYALAYGYAERCSAAGGTVTYERAFKVNVGHGKGAGAWVPEDVWFAGTIQP